MTRSELMPNSRAGHRVAADDEDPAAEGGTVQHDRQSSVASASSTSEL